MTVGAFEFFAGAGAEVGAGVDVMGAEAGAKSTAKREMLTTDGDPTACKSSPQDKTPPPGFTALLRVEVLPLQAGASALAAPPARFAGIWKGSVTIDDREESAYLDLKQSDDGINGLACEREKYHCYKLRFEGIEGDRLRFHYTLSDKRVDAELTLSPSGDTLTGTFTSDEAPEPGMAVLQRQ